MALHRRLLQDIAELQKNPYPNIVLCMQDDLQNACLLLTPDQKEPLHLTVTFGKDYPLKAPQVTMQSHITHPNVFGDYICASILNENDEYKPDYTLKGIAIALLSFFSSERIEQDNGRSVEWEQYGLTHQTYPSSQEQFRCPKCGFGEQKVVDEDLVMVDQKYFPDPLVVQQHKVLQSMIATTTGDAQLNVATREGNCVEDDDSMMNFSYLGLVQQNLKLPGILDALNPKSLLAAARVCSQIDLTVRMREIQCFYLKENFMNSKLGVGVHVSRHTRPGTLESEFDFLSHKAFGQFRVRRSVQGVGFEHWLPLPISQQHWGSVREDTLPSLRKLARVADISRPGKANIGVIYSFMKDVVVRLCHEVEQNWDEPKSTLMHATEKAAEAYFSLFHLLLCLATEKKLVVQDADCRLKDFLEGQRSIEACPDLGLLLVALLISDYKLSTSLTFQIIDEAVLRNVGWMLDKKGAGMAELSYIEPSSISKYRLQRTFEANKSSCRLLMVLTLFYRTARPPNNSIQTICDEMFRNYGAPPRGTAERIAVGIREIRAVNDFSQFFTVMGLAGDSLNGEEFCTWLKSRMKRSVEMGYSHQPISQGEALALRKVVEPEVEEAVGVVPSTTIPAISSLNFFPQQEGRDTE